MPKGICWGRRDTEHLLCYCGGPEVWGKDLSPEVCKAPVQCPPWKGGAYVLKSCPWVLKPTVSRRNTGSLWRHAQVTVVGKHMAGVQAECEKLRMGNGGGWPLSVTASGLLAIAESRAHSLDPPVVSLEIAERKTHGRRLYWTILQWSRKSKNVSYSNCVNNEEAWHDWGIGWLVPVASVSPPILPP